PILWVRASASPVTTVVPGHGNRLSQGVDVASGPIVLFDFNEVAVGGHTGEGPHSIYIQWQTTEGTWSDPIVRSISVDTTPPTVTPPMSAFVVRKTVGSTAAIRTSWSGSDALSGIQEFGLNRSGGTNVGWSFSPQ